MRLDYWKFKEDFDRRVTKKVRDVQSSLALQARLSFGHTDGLRPNELFGAIGDEQWFAADDRWLSRTANAARNATRHLPEEKVQLRFTGNSGDNTLAEGFYAYRLFKNIVRKHRGAFVSRDILDFGCGWGRIYPIFLERYRPEMPMGSGLPRGRLSKSAKTPTGGATLRRFNRGLRHASRRKVSI
jgi:hypothetical protein